MMSAAASHLQLRACFACENTHLTVSCFNGALRARHQARAYPQEIEMLPGDTLQPFSSGEPLKLTEDHVLSVLFVRRARSRIFGEHLFSDPAWDIILELFAARLGGKGLSLSELVVAVGSPASTTTRWVAILTHRGLVETKATATTSGPIVELTTAGGAKMEQLAGQWASAFVSI
jgi:DNA-binding MarR family transcriptional regulator